VAWPARLLGLGSGHVLGEFAQSSTIDACDCLREGGIFLRGGGFELGIPGHLSTIGRSVTAKVDRYERSGSGPDT